MLRVVHRKRRHLQSREKKKKKKTLMWGSRAETAAALLVAGRSATVTNLTWSAIGPWSKEQQQLIFGVECACVCGGGRGGKCIERERDLAVLSQDAGKNTTTRTDEREKGNLNLETKEPETCSSGGSGGGSYTQHFFRVAFPPLFPTEISQTQRIYDPFSGR